MSATRVPLNLFGIGFGLAGLGEAWGFAAGQGLAPRWVSDAILALSAVAWFAGISLYLRYAAATRGAFGADLRDTDSFLENEAESDEEQKARGRK